MYKNFLLSTLFIMIFLLTGCFGGQDNTVATAEGEMLKYGLGDLINNSKDGFYVLNKDDTFSPVMAGMSNYSELGDGSFLNKKESANRFIWFSDTEKIKLKNIIPVVTKDTPLVGFFSENNDIPESFKLEKYDSLGYTLGLLFKMSDDQTTINLDSSNVCPDSTAATFVERDGLNGTYEVVKFNESKDVPVTNVDTSTGLLFGLEKNKNYQIGYFDGTKYISSTTDDFCLKADTQIFRSVGDIQLDIPFDKSTDQYFKINLPDNLEEGYYYINEYGLFKYEK